LLCYRYCKIHQYSTYKNASRAQGIEKPADVGDHLPLAAGPLGLRHPTQPRKQQPKIEKMPNKEKKK
jgi:hypothetical protein